jgi:catechol 2,3-dioxygenase-like lactoylglutathione lyase family enzyme
MPLQIARVLETALYVEDLDRAVRFYQAVLGLTPMVDARPRLVAFDAGGGSVLLLFLRGGTTRELVLPEGVIPPHDGSGPVHTAFAVGADDLPSWEERLAAHGVAIESRVRWSRGGQSLYFRDPDGHSLELATPNTWPNY